MVRPPYLSVAKSMPEIAAPHQSRHGHESRSAISLAIMLMRLRFFEARSWSIRVAAQAILG
jgi:hypothetical protein